MTRHLPHLDSCELNAGEVTPPREAPAVDTAQLRLETWSALCLRGATNMLTVDGVSYSWEAHPRREANGALVGRMYAQSRGQGCRYLGEFRIGADGQVLQCPAELAGVLPGASRGS